MSSWTDRDIAHWLFCTCPKHGITGCSQDACSIKASRQTEADLRIFPPEHHSQPRTKKKQKLLDLPQHKLVPDVPMCRNSAFDMVERFLDLCCTTCPWDKKTRERSELQYRGKHNSSRGCCTGSEVTGESHFSHISRRNPNSVIAPLRARLLEEMHPAPSDPVMVKEMKSAVHQDLQKRYLLSLWHFILRQMFCIILIA